MRDQRLKTWERLFQHALSIIDAAVAAGATQGGWSFGGGTVLMRRHHHRISKDVDIFVPDPQWLGYRCCVCGHDLRMGGHAIGFEAAHIKWFQARGPDVVL
jgi:hypothetical protein